MTRDSRLVTRWWPPASHELPVTCLAIAAALLARTASAQAAPLAGLDAYITKAMAEWQVPGLAIAVVRDDSVIYERGYGVRKAGAPGAVDAHTRFPIASTSKAFTVAALGMLVDRGKLRWDDRVSQYVPDFRLRDAYVTQALTVRDLLTHRAGVSRSDNLWVVAPYGRAEVLRRARFLPAPDAFRAEYGYNNLMYILAGEVVGAASGTPWDDAVPRWIFEPLGMRRSTTRHADVAADSNVSWSHVRVDGRPVAVDRRNYDNIGGAGAIYSTAHDMAQWIRMHLAGGTYGGARILQGATLREMYTPQTVMRADTVAERMFGGTGFRAYGLGWFLQDYYGRKLVHHSGSINWTRTHVGMIPDMRVGVFVVANQTASNLQQALMYRVLDALTGRPPRDWSAEYLALARRADSVAAVRERATDSARVRDTKPSLPLDRYAGTYANDVYGEVTVAVEDGKLVLRYSDDYTADLEHWHHDTFVARWRRTGFGRSFVTFALDARANVSTMEVDELGVTRRVR